MSVIGFDIGNETCVIAAAKRGGVDVLLNDGSKSETPAVVSFGEKQRFFGSAGAACATANSKSTIFQIKRLIGKLYKEVEEDLQLLPFATSEGPRGGILIELEYLKKKWSFTPVEMLGMLLKHLKQIAEKNLDSVVDDCVIGIPSYFTDLQRRMYLDAAQIAGLRPLRLIHDGTAIALGYGIYKTDFSASGPTNVMFVDIGHYDTQVTVVAFELGKMKILSHSFDPNLGGRDFDEVLFHHFAAQFNKKYKIDVFANARASRRLRTSCKKLKKVLSAYAEAPLVIECLIGDTDVRGFISRNEFENLSLQLLERVMIPCSMALQDCGLSVDKIDSIELVGCASHIPTITRVLTKFFKKEPTRTLNASECVARGCALRCAMLSPSLIVRDYKIEESFPYSIIIPSPEREIMLFPSGSPFPKEKIIMHNGSTSLYFQVAYTKERDFSAGISHIVGHFTIGSSEPSDSEKVDVKIIVKLNNHGIVETVSAKTLEDKQNFRRNLYSLILIDNNRLLNLPISENIDFATTNDELREAKDKEKMLVEQDIKVEEAKDQRNTLLYNVYDTRRKLSGAYRTHAKISEKEVITKELQKTEDWLYEESDDEFENDYTGRLKDLRKLLEPIEYRYEENAVAKATSSLKSCIEKSHSHADSLPNDKKESLKKQCGEAEQWLRDAVSQKHSPPKTLSSEINRVISVFKSNCESIIRSKPPFLRYEEHVDSKSAREEAAKPLQTCIKKYNLLAESLSVEKKQKVNNECRKLEQWLVYAISEKGLSLKKLSTNINHNMNVLERKCNSIILSELSFPRHEEPVDSEQIDQTVKSDQMDESPDSDNARTVARKALQTCIAKYLSRAESLPADIKEKVKDECTTAEQWLSSLSCSFASPNTLATYINLFKERFESKCESIISSESSFPRQEEPVGSDQIEQTVELDQKDQSLDSDDARTVATKALQTCVAKYRSSAESLPTDMKEKVKDECMTAEQWLSSLSRSYSSPSTLATYINRFKERFESNCEGIIRNKPSSSNGR